VPAVDPEPESVREALALLDYHFFPQGGEQKYLRADSFHENAIRLVVFDMHLAIEELLRSHLLDALSARSAEKDATVDYVKALSSRQALDLAVHLGVIDARVYDRLRELNSLRNRAAHHWHLEEPIRHRSHRDGEPEPLVWGGRRLTPAAVKKDFLAVYGGIYESLLDSWTQAHPQAGKP
jgi:hypothetical protein